MNKTYTRVEDLGKYAVLAADNGERIFAIGDSGNWFSSKGGISTTHWGISLSYKKQKDRIMSDIRAVNALNVGESTIVVRGNHPKHGEFPVEIIRLN